MPEFEAPLRVGEATNWVDMVSLAALAVLFFYGLSRGFTVQLIGIVILALSLIAATFFGAPVGEWFGTKVMPTLDERVAVGLAYVVVFIVVIVLGSLLVSMLKGTIEKAKVIPYNGLFGGILGALKGALLIVVIVVLFVNFFYDPDDGEPTGITEDVVRSRTAEVSKFVAVKVAVFLPEKLADIFRGSAEKMGADAGD